MVGLRKCLYATGGVRSVYDWNKKIKVRGATILKLRIGNSLIGSCYIRQNYVFSLCVNPKYRKHGYGEALLDMASKEIAKKGYDKMLVIPADNEPKLRKWYGKLGFSGYSEDEPGYEEEDKEWWVMWRATEAAGKYSKTTPLPRK